MNTMTMEHFQSGVMWAFDKLCHHDAALFRTFCRDAHRLGPYLMLQRLKNNTPRLGDWITPEIAKDILGLDIIIEAAEDEAAYQALARQTCTNLPPRKELVDWLDTLAKKDLYHEADGQVPPKHLTIEAPLLWAILVHCVKDWVGRNIARCPFINRGPKPDGAIATPIQIAPNQPTEHLLRWHEEN